MYTVEIFQDEGPDFDFQLNLSEAADLECLG